MESAEDLPNGPAAPPAPPPVAQQVQEEAGTTAAAAAAPPPPPAAASAAAAAPPPAAQQVQEEPGTTAAAAPPTPAPEQDAGAVVDKGVPAAADAGPLGGGGAATTEVAAPAAAAAAPGTHPDPASPPTAAADSADAAAAAEAGEADPAAAAGSGSEPEAAAADASPRPQATAVQRLLIPLRALGAGGAASEAARLAFAVVDQRKKLAGYIESLGGTLPEGWQAAVKVRKVGSSAGSLDTTFIGPTGKKYRSKGDVARALGLTVPPPPPSPGTAAAGGSQGAYEDGGEGEEEGTPGSTTPKAAAASPAAPKASPLPGGRWRTKRASAAGAAKAVAAAKAAGERGEDEEDEYDEEDTYAPTADDDAEPPSPREGRGGVIKPDPILTREEAIERAVLKGEQLKAAGACIPLKLPNGVVVESLGQIDMRPSFCSLPNIWPVGYRAVFRDPHAGLFVSEIGVEPGKTRCQFTVSLVPKSSASARSATAAGGMEEEGGEAPPAAAADGGAAPAILLATARSPDAVWQAVVSLQTKLQSGAVSASVPTADGVPPEALGLLQKALSLKKCWGRAMYGFADIKVLQLIEAMPGAGELSGYKFAEQRGGWAQEAEVLRRGKWAKRSTIAEPLRHGSTPGGGGSGGAGSSSKAKPEKAAGGGSGGGKGRPSPAAAGQQVQPGLERFRDPQQWQQMSQEEQQDWLAIEATMNQALKKMEVWEIVHNSKNRRASGSAAAGAEAEAVAAAEGMAAASPSKKTLKTLTPRQILQKVFPHPKVPAAAAGGPGSGAAGAAGAGGGAEGALGSRSNTLSLTLHSQLSLALLEDMELPGATNMQLPGGAAALQHLSGEQAADLMQVWQFCCRFGSVLDLPEVPTLKQLEQGLLGVVSHSGLTAALVQAAQSAAGLAAGLTSVGSDAAPAAAEEAQAGAAAGEDAAAAGGTLEGAPSTASLHKDGSGSLAGAPSAAGATGQRSSSSSSSSTSADKDSAAAAGDAWVKLHVALLELLVGDAYGAVSTAEVLDLKPLEQRLAAPKVTLATWPEAARRYLVAAATALYLSAGETKSSAADAKKKTFELPGVLSSLEAADWAQHLCGGLNAPYLLSRVALLPQNSSDTAAESLSSLDDAAALAAAERTLQQLAEAVSGDAGGSSSSGGGAGAPSTTASPAGGGSSEQQQQALVARRLIQALVDVRHERGRKGSGARMCFCAQELGPLAGWTTGLDLHTIAARLQSGLYAATQQPLASLAADLTLMCDMWRAAFDSEQDQIHGFDGADATLADAVEERLQELLAAVEGGDDLRSVVNTHVVFNPEWLMPVQPPQPPAAAGDGAAVPALPAAEGAANGPLAAAADGGCKEEVQLALPALNGHAADTPVANGIHPGPSSSSSPMDVDLPAAGASTKAPAVAAGVKQEQQPGPGSATPTLQQEEQQNGPQQQQKLQDTQPEQQQDQQQQNSELVWDPHNLLNAGRPFNPLAGCKVCWRETDEASLLLCDRCNDEYHCYCVTPQLLAVPEGDWYCPVCSRSSGASPETAPAPAAAAAEPGTALLEATRQAGAVSLSPSARLAPVRQAWGLLETAELLTRLPYGAWPAASRLRLLSQLCELVWSTTPMLEYWEQQNEVRREAQKQLYESRMKLSRARKAAAAEAKRVADEARAAAAAAATQAALAAAAAAGIGSPPAAAEGADAEGGGDAGDVPVTGQTPGEQEDVEMQEAGPPADDEAAAAAPEALQEAPSGAAPEAAEAALPPLPPAKGGKGKKGGKGTKGGKGAAAKQAAADAGNPAAADAPTAAAPTAAAAAAAAASEPVDEAKELMLMAEQQRLLEVTALRSSCLGTDRWHNRYWCLGTSQLPHAGKAAAVAGKGRKGGRGGAGSGGSGVGHPGWLFVELSEQYMQHQAAATAAAPDAGAAGEHPATAGQPLLLGTGSSDCPSNISSSQAAAGAALDSVGPEEPAAGVSWVQFTSIAELDAVMCQLNSAGLRERTLLDALHRVREAWLLFAPDPDAAEAQPAPAAAGGEEAVPSGDGAATGAGEHVGAEGAADQQPPAQDAATAAAEAAAATDDVDMEHAPEQPAAAAADDDAPDVSPTASFAELQQAAAASEAVAAIPQLRARLSRLLSSFPDASFQPFWGSKQRREAWEAALEAADSPGAFVALLGVLQTMLLQDSFRGVWRLWATPVQQQEVVHTWPGVWYRLLAFESTKKPILPTKEQRLRAQEAVWKARKAEAAAAAAARAAARAEAEQQAAAAAAAAGADAAAPPAAEKAAGAKKRGRGDAAAAGQAAPAAAAGGKGSGKKQGKAAGGKRAGDSSAGITEASEDEQECQPHTKKQKTGGKAGKPTAAAAVEKGSSKGKGKQKAAAGRGSKAAAATKEAAAAAAAAGKGKVRKSSDSGSDSDFVASEGGAAEDEDDEEGSSSDYEAGGKKQRRAASDEEDSAVSTEEEEEQGSEEAASTSDDSDNDDGSAGNGRAAAAAAAKNRRGKPASSSKPASGKGKAAGGKAAAAGGKANSGKGAAAKGGSKQPPRSQQQQQQRGKRPAPEADSEPSEEEEPLPAKKKSKAGSAQAGGAAAGRNAGKALPKRGSAAAAPAAGGSSRATGRQQQQQQQQQQPPMGSRRTSDTGGGKAKGLSAAGVAGKQKVVEVGKERAAAAGAGSRATRTGRGAAAAVDPKRASRGVAEWSDDD